MSIQAIDQPIGNAGFQRRFPGSEVESERSERNRTAWTPLDSALPGGSAFVRLFSNARQTASPGLCAYCLLLVFGAWSSAASSAGSPYDGYNLFQTLNSSTAYLMDNNGSVVHSWATDYRPGNSMYLLEDGDLLHTGNLGNTSFGTGGSGGIVQRIDWNGNVTWEYEYSSTTHLQHHDVELLPNGNVLMIAWEYKSQSEAIAAGRNPSALGGGTLWPDSVIEIEPSGTNGGAIVWEWHAWDHLVQDYDPNKANYGAPGDHPERIDLNYYMNTNADWLHVNSVDYNPDLDQIILSVHNFSELWIIDHSTTTTEAAGHSGGNSGKGGDLLYRWGNPQTYGAGVSGDQKLFVPHDAEWIESGLPAAGNIIVFNNGQGRPGGNYSSIEEIAPPLETNGNYSLAAGQAYGPDATVWSYTANNPTDFFAQNISGQQRLPNGNTLICEGPSGYFFEVTDAGETVWDYSADGTVFRVERYAPEYPGFDGTVLDVADNDPAPPDTGTPITSNPACPDGSDITISDYTYASGESVVCSGKTTITAGPGVVVSSAASVTYSANQSITLKPGFQISNQAQFQAMVGAAATGAPPTADAGGPYSGQVNATILLDGSGSSDSDGSVTAYAWDLNNDGQYDDAVGSSAAFSSTTAGAYTVALRVTDDDGLTDSDSTTVTISQGISTDLSYPVVDTAQNLCFSANGSEQSCTGVGYDADYTGNAPNYSLSADGAIVTDQVTGLLWTQTPDLDGNGVVDAADKLSLNDADAYCAGLTLGGNDWRLPSIKELYSLMDFRGTDPSSVSDTASTLTPFINDTYFQPGFGDTAAGERIIDGQFATSTLYISPAGTINGATTMFGVNFVDGRIKGYGYSSMRPNGDKTFYTLCATGNTAYGDNDFVDNGDGTVSDAATGLMWQQADASGLNFEEAIAYCETDATGNWTDWRLPNVKELHSIVDYSRAPDYSGSAAIDPVFDATSFINEVGQTDWGYYWSSTTHMNSNSVGTNGAYVAFGRALGYMNSEMIDVHGAGAQRSNNKIDVSNDRQMQTADLGYGLFYYFGPQGDIGRSNNMVRCVRDGQ